MKEVVQSDEPAAISRGDASSDEPLLEGDAQIVITVQISQTLHPQLFSELTRAKKRDRAERVRWLCQGGLTAERQVARHASAGTVNPSSATHEFTPCDPRSAPRVSQLSFAPNSVSRPPDSGEDDTPSVLSHPDISGLLL